LFAIQCAALAMSVSSLSCDCFAADRGLALLVRSYIDRVQVEFSVQTTKPLESGFVDLERLLKNQCFSSASLCSR
jgi:hypothetical protein